MSQLLRNGRGAVIPLDASESDEFWILANNHPPSPRRDRNREDRIAITVRGRPMCTTSWRGRLNRLRATHLSAISPSGKGASRVVADW